MNRHESHVFEPRAPVASTSDALEAPPIQRVFTREAVQAIDRAAIEEYGIPGIVLMENAARGLLDHALPMISSSGDGSPSVLIVCGSGNNGGDGYALARHL